LLPARVGARAGQRRAKESLLVAQGDVTGHESAFSLSALQPRLTGASVGSDSDQCGIRAEGASDEGLRPGGCRGATRPDRPDSARRHLCGRLPTHGQPPRLSLTRAIATTRDPLGITMVEAPSPSGPTRARPSSPPARRDESRRWDSPNRRSASPERGCAVGTRRRPCGAARGRGRVRATVARGFANVPGGWGT
jgi:hypothetical protein